MKMERVTDNKIRIIVKTREIKIQNIKSKTLISDIMETDDLFLKVLEQAEKELDFNTDGCKLLIEAFSYIEDVFIFTITKYKEEENNKFKSEEKARSIGNNKKLYVRRKTLDYEKKFGIFKFEDFETFCDLCKHINKLGNIKNKKIADEISLYLYKDKYFLVMNGIRLKDLELNKLYSIISEFAKIGTYSKLFENKLMEYGEIIMNKNALKNGIKYFT